MRASRRLGDRHVDRCDQWRADRRKRAEQPSCATSRLLAASGKGPATGGPRCFKVSPASFSPRAAAWAGPLALVGLDQASYYSTEPLKRTLESLVDLKVLREAKTRLTMGAVAVRSGELKYFDSRDAPLRIDHVMASAALPPAFAAVRIEGEAYWDGGVQAWVDNAASLRRRPKAVPAVIPPVPVTNHIAAVRQDVRYAWRVIKRQPGYAALLIATMALGIAATTLLGSVAYGVLLKPLPWANAPRLVRFYETRQGSTRRTPPVMTNLAYLEWQRDRARSTRLAHGRRTSFQWATNGRSASAQRR